MTYMKTIFIIILFLLIKSCFFCDAVKAQTTSEVKQMKSVIKNNNVKPGYKYARENINEIQYFFSGLFLFYKTFISSQDGQSCSFTPSCSEFGMEAVKSQGVFIGILNTFDRLTRCNSLSPEKYTIHPHTHLLYDPL